MSFNPQIDENYFARTEKHTENLFTYSKSIYTMVFYVAGFIITITITIPALWMYYITKQMDIKSSKPQVFSIAITVAILMLYILALDIAAVVTLKDKTPILNDRNFDDNAFPYIVLLFDGSMVVLWGVCWVLTFVTWISSKCTESRRCCCCSRKQFLYLLQALLTIGPIFMLVTHLPYIAISYLNDSSYSSSIFIYYTVVAFVIFGSLKFICGICQQTVHSRKASSSGDEEHDGIGVHSTSTINNGASPNGEERTNLMGREDASDHPPTSLNPFCSFANLKKNISCKCIRGSIGIVVFMLLVLLLIGMTTAALVVVPISRAFSDAPNRLLGFYETVVVVAGAYLAYKGIFDRKPTLESAIKKRKWQIPSRRNANGDTNGSNQQNASDSEDERLAAFYDHVVNIVLNYKTDSTKEKEI